MKKFIIILAFGALSIGSAIAQSPPQPRPANPHQQQRNQAPLLKIEDDTLAFLSTFGFTVQDASSGRQSIINLTVNHRDFFAAVPRLKKADLMNSELTQTFINSHRFVLSGVFGVKMAPAAANRIMTINQSVQLLTVRGFASYADDYGNEARELLFSFDLPRSLYERINWDTFDTMNITKIAPNFRYSNFMLQKIREEGL